MQEEWAVGQKHTEEQVNGQDVIECESEIERKRESENEREKTRDR